MRNQQPSVAIIIPCFNRWPHVREAIDSVLAQTWQNTHCIIVDDVSTDDSYSRLKENYGSEPKVSVHQLETNRGQSAARNFGVDRSNADYIGFLDSDDLLVETAVASRMRLAVDHPDFEGIIFGDKIDEDSQKSLLPGEKEDSSPLTLSEYIEDMGWLHTNSFIMKRIEFQTLKGFNEKLRKKEDVEFFLRALGKREALYGKGPCCMVRNVDTHRARHDHKRIIQQGERFIDAIQNNPSLTSVLTQDQIKKLVEADTRSVLQSLYRMKQGQRFRSTMREAFTSGKLRLDVRMTKRYLLSFFR
ncbi:glycosyltransferase family 2 protein [Halomonas ramblicola]|uniref:glycosyltransferase family 2 protein n=1 Tax=Halomonas ramblicola TaxID=747349 RepID=UPI0025B44DE1|nr:glycosyltransferase [Halomonas ramblicola]MDN3522071.1 glycosyltransferase [Halomonas ramblicola]